MIPLSAKWKQLIRDGAEQIGVPVSDAQVDLFSRHADLLLQWNRRINLTAIVDPTEMAVKHYLDAIAPLHHIPADGPLLDIGTGGGFPGIPLKIMRPHQPMTLIDSVRKKISFVRHAIRELGLPAIDAHQSRAETFAQLQDVRRQFRVIVCRALSDLSRAVSLSEPLLAPQGCIVAYQGPQQNHSQGEGGAVELSGYHVQSHRYRLPVLGDQRIVTILTPNSE